MMTLLEARNVTKVFGGGHFSRQRTVALDGVSLVIGGDRPVVISVAGESGSGKTTLARLLLGISPPSIGEIRYKGKEVREMSRGEWRVFRREVQAIFQDPFEVYNPFYRVEHVLTTPIAKFGLASSRGQRRDLIENALQTVGLRPEETLGRYPHQLSGGQRQRIMVARALLLQPRIILADEPVSMVDASLRATILESLLKLNRELGISLVYVTHDLTTAYQVSENIMVMYQGSVTEVGDVELVIKDPRHPYTQLLVGSIPLPDPKRRWSQASGPGVIQASSDANKGCKFADRCPHVMPMCWESRPPLFRVDFARAATCHLYREADTVDGVELMETLSQARSKATQTATDA